MITLAHIPGGLLLLDNGAARLTIHSADELHAALQRLTTNATKGNDTMSTPPPTAGRRMPTETLPDLRRPPVSTDDTGAMDFKDAPAPAPDVTEKHVSITIEVTPAGLSVRADYIGSLTSIPKAIERLRAAGVLELVQASAPAAVAVAPKAKSPTGEVVYGDDGTPVCKYHGAMKESDRRPGSYYCPKKLADGTYCKERA